MKIYDLAQEIWEDVGELRGGEINFIAMPPAHETMPDGVRYLAFRVDDNDFQDDGSGANTVLGVATRQPARELRDIIRWGGQMSVRVHHIGKPLDMIRDNDTGAFQDVRTVFGRLTLHSRGQADGFQAHYDGNRIRHLPPPIGPAMVTPTKNAAGDVVHVHLLMLDADTALPVTRAEKIRRLEAAGWIATAGRSNPSYRRPDRLSLDGDHRGEAISAVLRGQS